MKYSFEKITTVAECDGLLAVAQKKKTRLERRRRNLRESIDAYGKRMDRNGQESALVQAKLEILTAAYHALPEGSRDKVCMNIEVKRLELRKALLEKKTLTCNVPALLARQLHYNRLDSQVSAIDSYIIAVQNKRTALSLAALQVRDAESPDPGSIEFQPKPDGLLRESAFLHMPAVRQRLFSKKWHKAHTRDALQPLPGEYIAIVPA